MTSSKNNIQKKLVEVINESLALLEQSSIKEQKLAKLEIPMPSLLDQCLALCEQHHTQAQEPLRTVHHFGLPLDSILLSSLATLANTRVIKDIHPNINSYRDAIQRRIMAPKSIQPIGQMNNSSEDNDYRINVFLSDLQQMQQQSNQVGQRLLICDNHCLSQTSANSNVDLLAILNRQFNSRSLIIVADPVDSYHSYRILTQTDKSFLDFEDYCRSILDFMRAHSELTVIRHEDFVDDPKKVMQEICAVLDLPFNESFLILGELFGLEES